MDPIGASILDQQRAYYGINNAAPAMLPHGDDPKAVPRRNSKRRKKPPQKSTVFPSPPTGTELEKVLPASELPNGFPPELAFRALAAYATVRTLSLQLRLSPFTPNVFLRALYLPFPNRLLGRVHTHILRVLLSHLQMGYHWKECTPPLDAIKKRKRDGIRWPLRGGDNLRYLDSYTWPVFFDDYCHLTADILHAALHDETDYIDSRNLDISGMESENHQGDSSSRSRREPNQLTVLYMEEDDEDDSEEEFQMDDVPEEDDDDYSVERPKKRRKSNKKEAPPPPPPPVDHPSHTMPQSRGATDGYYYNNNISNNIMHPTMVPRPYVPMQFSFNTTREQLNNQIFYAQMQQSFAPQYGAGYAPQNGASFAPQNGAGFAPQNGAATYTGNVMQYPFATQNGAMFAGYEMQGMPPAFRTDHFLASSYAVNRWTLPQVGTGFPTQLNPIREFYEPWINNGFLIQPAAGISEKKSPEQPRTTASTRRPSDSVSSSSTTSKRGGVVDGSVFLIKAPSETMPYDGARAVSKLTETDTNDPAYLLEAFIQGKRTLVPHHENLTENKTKGGNSDIDDDESVSFPTGEWGQWPHFGPLKTMRAGVAYHNLSVEEKLVMLEFLLDELLSIDTIAAGFSERHDATSRFDFPYGPKPSELELQHMIEADGDLNANACGVCGEEGNLVCCDGCVGAYHQKCVMMPQTESDPADWFCPECELKDPATLGPLNGGQKSTVDWFTVEDVEKAHEYGNGQQTYNAQNFASFGTSASDIVSREDHSKTEFLVVHGFVFSRSREKDREDRATDLLLSVPKLQNILCSLGVDFCSKWPIEQVPKQASLLFRNPSLVSNHPYFKTSETFDPSLYDNKYRAAPLPSCVRRVKDAHVLDYEVRCIPVTTRSLSYVLSSDMSSDKTVAESLRTSQALFGSYQMISLFLLKIENDLVKACLIDEFWKTRQTAGAHAWSTQVSNCRSVRRLAHLLVQLVDATHPQAFLEGWFHSARLRPKGPEISHHAEAKVSLSHVFSPKDEAWRRHWERSNISNIPNLVAKSSKRLDNWIREIRPDLGSTEARNGKRKQAYGKQQDQSAPLDQTGVSGSSLADPIEPKQTHEIHQDQNAPLDQAAVVGPDFQSDVVLTTPDVEDTMPCGVKGSFQDDPTLADNDAFAYDAEIQGDETELSQPPDDSTISNKLRKRRKSDRVHPSLERHYDSFGDAAVSSLSYSNSVIDAQMRRKVADLMSEVRIVDVTEGHWPVAGRKLFDPVGYLPKSTIRYLGRNAGGYFAPFVTYSSLHEVGQVAYAHVWRKRVLLCTSFEELLMLLRALEAFLDDGTIRKCISLAQRCKGSKAKLSSEIIWTQRDLATGIDYHLVGKPSGSSRWASSLEVDLGPLILERSRRRHVRVEAMSELSRNAAAKTQKADSSTIGTMSADRSQPSDKSQPFEKSQPTDQLQPTDKFQSSNMSQTAGTETVLADHKRKAKEIIQTHGLSLIPFGELESLRLTALAKLQSIYALKGLKRTKEQIFEEIAEAEAEAVKGETATCAAALKRRPARLHPPVNNASATMAASSNVEAEAARPLSSSSRDQRESRKIHVAIPRAPIATSQHLISIAAQVIQDHIAGTKHLLNIYGEGGIPINEFVTMREMHTNLLSQAMQSEGIKVGREQLTAVLSQAEEDAYSQVAADTNQGPSGMQQPRSAKRAAADSLPIQRHNLSHPSSVNHTQALNQSAYPFTQTASRASPYPGQTEILGSSNGQTAETSLSMTRNATSFPRGYDTGFDDFSNSSTSYHHQANGLGVDTSRTGRAHDDASWNSPAEAGTPLSVMQQVVAQHKDATRAILRKYGASFPPSALQPSRQRCLSNLADVLQMAGIIYSADKISAVLIEAETDVLGEETAKIREPIRMSGAASASLMDTAMPFNTLGQSQGFPIAQAQFPSPQSNEAFDPFGSAGNSSRFPVQQQWHQAQFQPNASQHSHSQSHSQQFLQHHQQARRQLPPQGVTPEMNDADLLNALSLNFTTHGQGGVVPVRYGHLPGDAYDHSTFQSDQHHANPYFNTQPSLGSSNLYEHNLDSGQSMASLHAGNSHGWYQQGSGSGTTALFQNGGQSHERQMPPGQRRDGDALEQFQNTQAHDSNMYHR